MFLFTMRVICLEILKLIVQIQREVQNMICSVIMNIVINC